MPQQWRSWDWQRSQSKSQRKPRPSTEKGKSEGGDNRKFPSYSYDSSSLPASTTGMASSSTLQGKDVIDLLKKIAGQETDIITEVQKILPAAEEEEEAQKLRQQQKLLNQIRKLQVKLGKKEGSVAQKEQQMQKFLQDIRQHVETEKSRHKKEVEQLQAEIEEIKTQLRDLKSGKPVEVKQEEDLEDILMVDDEEKIMLRQQLDEAKQNQLEMQQQVNNMQEQMAQFMQTYQGAMQADGAGGAPGTTIPTSPGQNVKTPLMMSTEQAKLVKDPKAPFGARLQPKNAREAASPYGPTKPLETGMD